MNELLDLMKNTFPRYNTVQPSTGAMVSFRPFNVKEEKILLMANQTGSYEDFLTTLSEVIDNCFTLKTPAIKLPLFDIEFLFLKLRSKSISEIAEPKIVCPVTKEQVQIKVNLDEIEPIIDKNHSKEIKIGNSIFVKLNYPTLEYFIKNEGSDYFDMIVNCIESIQTPKELIEAKLSSKSTLKEFVELLSRDQFIKIIEFFKTMPKIEKEVNYTTKDNEERKIVLKGLRDFFQ